MQTLLIFVGFILCSLFANSQSQAEMNIEASKNYKKADEKLNDVYQRILKEYSGDATFVKNFKKAQKIWIQLRDAEMAAKYPHPDEYGSVFPMCYAIELQNLTEERTKRLKVWLTGIEEGDVCSGSVKTK